MMKALRLHAVGDIRCDRVEVPIPHGEELLLKVRACGVCGSDFSRTFVNGSSNGKYPLTIGHEFAGEVTAVGETADPALIGTYGAVFPLIPCRQCSPCKMSDYALCEHYDYLGSRRDGGFAEYCLLPSAWHLIRSQGAPMEALAMTEPACVAQHAVRRSGLVPGQFIVIFGAGPIGIMAARWAAVFGAAGMLLVDISQPKVAFAQRLGFHAVNSTCEDVADEIRRLNQSRIADAAIEGTGAGSALLSCVACVRPHGTVTLLGNPAGDAVITPLIHSMMLRKEISLKGVWNSSRAPLPVDEWNYTVSMLDSGKLIVTDLISDRVSLDEMPEALRAVRDKKRQIVKMMYV